MDRNPRALPTKWAVSVWCAAAAFGTYLCVDGFRKPFTAATYADTEGPASWGGYKTDLVAAQVPGYTLPKFLGIKVVPRPGPAVGRP